MELDDLKRNWNNTAQQVSGYDLDQLLIKTVNNPLDILRMKYIRQMVMLPLGACFLIAMSLKSTLLAQNIGIWIIVPVLFLLTFNYYRNYRIVVLMQRPAGQAVKQTLEKYLYVLQKNGRIHLQMIRVLLVIFICVVEIMLYKDLVPAYHSWRVVALPFRLGTYFLLLMLQPYLSRYFFKLNFGQYINRLKELLDQAS